MENLKLTIKYICQINVVAQKWRAAHVSVDRVAAESSKYLLFLNVSCTTNWIPLATIVPAWWHKSQISQNLRKWNQKYLHDYILLKLSEKICCFLWFGFKNSKRQLRLNLCGTSEKGHIIFPAGKLKVEDDSILYFVIIKKSHGTRKTSRVFVCVSPHNSWFLLRM